MRPNIPRKVRYGTALSNEVIYDQVIFSRCHIACKCSGICKPGVTIGTCMLYLVCLNYRIVYFQLKQMSQLISQSNWYLIDAIAFLRMHRHQGRMFISN